MGDMTHYLRKIFSRSSAPFNLARRYSRRASYRAVTSALRLLISANSACIACKSSSSSGGTNVLGLPEAAATLARSTGETGVLKLVASRACLPSVSATGASGRCPLLLVKLTLDVLPNS